VEGRWRDALLLVELRRRRRVARLLRRMDRLDARSAPRRPGGGHRRSAAAASVVVLMLGGLFVASMLGDDGSVSSASDFPDRPADAEQQPIGSPVTVADRSDDYAFVEMQDGGTDPVTYDPCVPIHLVVDTRRMVDDGMQMLEEALDEVRDATGLSLIVDGLTDEPARDDGTVTDADGAWLPVTVSWSDPKESSRLEGDVAGFAGSASVDRDGRRWFVTGSVVLDGPQLAEILDGPRGWQSARSVVMHELAHLVGLDHVDAPGQLMQPEGSDSLTSWGAGDLTGLAALGRGTCIDY